MEQIVMTTIPLETIEKRFSNVVDQKFQQLLLALQQSQAPHQKKFLSRKETAKRLGISLPTLNDWTKEGIVVGYRIASRVRYKEDEIEAALIKIKTTRRAA
jgi:excisionase family DNA binding protein